MKPSLIFLLAAAQSAYGSLQGRAVCSSDTCASALTAAPAKTDCSSFQRVTVTVGNAKVVPVVTVTGTESIPRPTLPATDIPTAVPSYATACVDAYNGFNDPVARYGSACSCLGVPKTTTTVTVSTLTVTVGPSTTTRSTTTDTRPPLTIPPHTVLTTGDATSTPKPTISARPIAITSNSTVNNIPAQQHRAVLYGSKNNDNTYFWSQIVFTAKTGDTLVNTDDFQPFIGQMTCGTGSIGITFSSAEALNKAKTWPATFTLITSGSSYCAPDNKHAFYKVSKVNFASLTATLTVSSIPIDEAIEEADGQYGTIAAPAGSSKHKRDFFSDLAQTLHDALTKDVSASKSTTIDIDSTFFKGNQAGQSIAANVAGINIDGNIYCEGCGIQAKITLEGTFSCSVSKGCSKLTAGMKLTNAKIVALFTLAIEYKFQYNVEAPLYTQLIYPIDIGDVLTIKPSVQLYAGMAFALYGPYQINNIGFTASMDDSSVFLDVANGRGSATGWHPTFSVKRPTLQNVPPQLDFTAFVAPRLNLELAFVKKISYNAFVMMKTPDVRLRLNNYNPNDDCGTGNGLGSYKIGLDAGLILSAGATGTGIPSQYNNIAIWSSPRFNIIPQLFPENQCFPLPRIG